MDNNDTTLLASSGDYHQLICYQKTVIVYDLTYWFCERYMERSKDRHLQPIWAKDSVEMKALWAIGKEHSDSEYFMQLARTRPPQTTANIARGMTEQAIFFLDRLIQSKVKQFVENGGLKEQMYRVRQQYRQQSGYYNKGSNGINGMNGIN